MLLFLLHDRFRESPGEPSPAVARLDQNARALLAAGLFLSTWCVLRLLAARGEHFGVDAALAVSALYLGLRASWYGVRHRGVKVVDPLSRF